MKHTKENCNTCGVELTDTNWNISWKKTNRTQCQDCNNPNRTRHNPDRMFVNSMYVRKSHPLHKEELHYECEEISILLNLQAMPLP